MAIWHEYGIPTWVLVVTITLLLIILHINRKLKYWKNRNVPSTSNNLLSLISGLYISTKKPLHEQQMNSYKKYGRTHGLFIGTKPWLTVGEPDYLKSIMVKDFNKFHRRTNFKTGEVLFDKMLSLLSDEDWKRVRCIMSPTFSSSRMRKMAYLIKECAENFTKYFERLAEEHEWIDCKRYLSSYTIDVTASTAFGTKLDSLQDPNNEFATKARSVTNVDTPYLRLILNMIPIARRIISSDNFSVPFRYFGKFALHAIERRQQEKIKRNDFLQLMIEAQRGTLEKTQEDIQEEKNENYLVEELPKHKTMSTDEMLAQCSLFIFAGSETTSATLSFFLYYMALYPDYQEKLIEEVDETWKNHENMDFDILNKMPYLDLVLSETLRIKPITPIITRECTEDYTLGDTGIKIPKSMIILIPVYAMHHDPEFYPNPEHFDPERFIPENRSSIPQCAYLPFGDGPRNCIGRRFAMMVIKMCIVHLFKNLRVHATEETKKPLEFYLGQGFLQPKKIIIKLEKRKH